MSILGFNHVFYFRLPFHFIITGGPVNIKPKIENRNAGLEQFVWKSRSDLY